MSISIISEPGSFVLAKNQIPYLAATDNYITTAGEAFVATLVLVSITEGQTLELNILGNTFEFVFTDSPTGCSDVDTSSEDGPTIKANLWARLAENYFLALYYDLSPGTNTITAKNTGTQYAITQGGTGTFTFTVVNAGVTEVTRENLRIYWDLWMSIDQPTPNWKFIVGQQLAPDEVSRIDPDMADLIRGNLAPDVPFYGTDVIAYNVNSIKKFHCRSAEYYDSAVHCYAATSTRQVMLAGIAKENWPFINFDAVYGAGVVGQLFLTNQPRRQVVDAFCKTFLSILVGADYTVKADILWDDNTSTTETLFTVAGNTKSMAIIPTGYDALDISQYATLPAVNAIEYSVYLTQGANNSEKFTYSVDWKNKINPRYFLVHNSLNGWDSIFATGDQGRSLNTEGSSYDGPLSRTFKADASETNLVPASTKQDEPLQKRYFEQNTGFKNRLYVQTLARELGLSAKVYIDTGSRFIELEIDRASIKEVDNDADETPSLNFTFSLGFKDMAL